MDCFAELGHSRGVSQTFALDFAFTELARTHLNPRVFATWTRRLNQQHLGGSLLMGSLDYLLRQLWQVDVMVVQIEVRDRRERPRVLILKEVGFTATGGVAHSVHTAFKLPGHCWLGSFGFANRLRLQGHAK